MELFVSDLDGTLLTSDREISVYSKEHLNNLISNGLNFAIATARSPATAVDILSDINLKLPSVLMNGVLIYDIKKEEYIEIKDIPREAAHKAIDIFERHNKSSFIYSIKNNHLWVYYKALELSMETQFYNERCNKPLKTFVKVNDYKESIGESPIINFIIFDDLEKVTTIYEELKHIKELTVDYYKDIYGDGYYLEAYSSEASKANGIKYLSKYVKSNKLITFGDNVNDIPMFKISDECYAMENANDELKNIATQTIGNNNQDGVVKFIEKIRFK